jgi:hypothetical protein
VLVRLIGRLLLKWLSLILAAMNTMMAAAIAADTT